MIIRDAVEADAQALLELNAESERFLSPLDPPRMHWLLSMAAHRRVIDQGGSVVAFLLALREGTAYDSPNYRWFTARYSSFLYVDRIVVALAEQGKQLGGALYDDLFVSAQSAGITTITCEFDLEPPNEASRRFHARYGFREVGTQWLADGKKRVSLQEAPSLRI